MQQAKNPTRRGVTVWVETDGTVYWAVPEDAIATHGDGANRNDNGPTFRQVLKTNSIGVEFAGNFPDVAKPASAEQIAAWRILVRVLQARYGIPDERIYAHNWIDYKDARYLRRLRPCDVARGLAFSTKP
jgi:N-acetyl-anhydromuramyl-L-alanine amidase AmpD